MIKENNTRVIGIMSGTSLDGLDICLAQFTTEGDHWKYEIESAETFPYSSEWISKLVSAEKKSKNGRAGEELMPLHSEYGKFLGEQVISFIEKNKVAKPEFVASHGHTIFHEPARFIGEKGYTFQLGAGAALRAACGIPVVCDFRTLDVSLGGQGAPLVPIGDALLFGQYDYCLNLGGFANISFDKNGKRIAYDICPANYVLNYLARRVGKQFDDEGNLAASGKIISTILENLDALPYYKKSAPKSLGREWVEESVFPLLAATVKTEDLLRTYTEHIVGQISKSIAGQGKLLITGGGAHNSFFINRLKEKCKNEIIIPDSKTIDFKEALVFAFLGLLRWRNQINTLASVTGAIRNSSGGEIFR